MSHFGFAAKRLITSSAAMAFSSRIVTVRWRRVVDDALAQHVLHVEHVVVRLLAVSGGRPCGRVEERLRPAEYQVRSLEPETSSLSG